MNLVLIANDEFALLGVGNGISSVGLRLVWLDTVGIEFGEVLVSVLGNVGEAPVEVEGRAEGSDV